MEVEDGDSSSSTPCEVDLPGGVKRRPSSETGEVSIEALSRHTSKFRRIIYTSESEDEAQTTPDPPDEWTNPTGNQPTLTPFSGTPGPTPMDYLQREEDFYLLLVTEEMFEEVAEQTNILAMRMYQDKWVPTNKFEIKKLFGLLIWMGLVKLPEVGLYWSKDPTFAQTFPQSVMPKSRFEVLLRVLSFVSDDGFEDRLCKIKPIIDKLRQNYVKYYNPPEVLYIDECIVPFRTGVVSYTKQKRLRYGVKLFKLCCNPGYTYNFTVYCGQQGGKDKTTPKMVALGLCENIFDRGHTLCVDSWYSSIDLAEELISRNTHLIGTVRPSRGRLSKEVVRKRLRRGEVYAKENKRGMTLMKWKGKRDFLLLSTKHSTEVTVVSKKGLGEVKPKLLVDYNEARSCVDSSDLMPGTVLRSLKWYKKVAFELLLNTSVVNAWILCNGQQNGSLSLVEFRKRLVNYLCNCESEIIVSPEIVIDCRERHEIRKQEGKAVMVRKRCTSCYKQNVKMYGTDLARQRTRRVVTFCSDCPNRPFLCIPCFQLNHFV